MVWIVIATRGRGLQQWMGYRSGGVSRVTWLRALVRDKLTRTER